ncbi:MAG: NAD kinase [Bacteroidales bacterium]|jgi:NAD+ kinase|nr:NAD kinase [Bacteroidales bacterium]MBQ5404764.1 NAD kinase [Bacteroidales bacterium]MBR6277533.1 NAD kinase [Bacteroidales bacterium]
MKVAIFGRKFSEGFNKNIYRIFETLNRNNCEIYVFEEYLNFIVENLYFTPRIAGTFTNSFKMPEDLDLLISIGGDGTMLESVVYAVAADIPVVGINSGRLGFLVQVSDDTLQSAMAEILSGRHSVENRTLIEVTSTSERFGNLNIALNEVTIMRVNTSSMISINVYLNDEFLNTYWSDGLIIATPTGSTAYSLSAGGPIITPGSGNFVLTPVSPHNLSVRPIVISDDNVLRLKAQGRENNYLASLDFRQACLPFDEELTLKKSTKKLKLVKLSNTNFYNTLRNKLLWGMDKRN